MQCSGGWYWLHRSTELNTGYTYRDTIQREHHGWTALDYYSSVYKHSSVEEWQQEFAGGNVTVAGSPILSEFIISTGMQLEWHRAPWVEPEVTATFEELYEDDSVLIVHKPEGLPVLPGGGFLQHTLLHLVREQHGEMLSPVHRLGRGTTGAIMFTKNKAAAEYYGTAMRDRTLQKIYLAMVQGVPEEREFTVDSPIGLVPYPPVGELHASKPGGKSSTSHVTVLQRYPDRDCSLVQVEIPTGRPHQIRIHMGFAGHPLVGDPLYTAGGLPITGGTAVPGDCGYFLHSWKLTFPLLQQPSQTITAIAPPPAALQNHG